MEFKAVMFDFDGTITKKGVAFPSKKMVDALIRTAMKVPIAFCTGRQLSSFERHGLQEILKEVPKKDLEKFLKNLFLFTENGAIGYFYNTKKAAFEEFYRAKWPRSFIEQKKFKKMLAEKLSGLGDVMNIHEIVVVTRPKRRGKMSIGQIYKRSGQMLKKTKELLGRISPHYERHLHIGNSGIGVIVCPAGADKDRAIFEFANYLNKKRHLALGKRAREILVIGDSAQPYGNDHYFLKGDFGTPYNVGAYKSSKAFPKTVLNEKGKKLLHAVGTIHLLKSLKLSL